MYSYVDPCTKDFKYISGDMSAPIMIAYYGQVKSFRYEELYNGTFDAWINSIYNKYKTTSPCQGAVATTTTTTTTTLATTVVNSVMNLNSIASIASMGTSLNVGAATDRGTNNQTTTDEESNSDNTPRSNPTTSNNNDRTNSGSNGSGNGSQKGNTPSTGSGNSGSSSNNPNNGNSNGEGQSTGQVGENTSENQGGSGSQSGGGVDNNGNSSGSGSDNNNTTGGGNGSGTGTKKKTSEEETGEVPAEQEAQEENAGTGQDANKSASKSKTNVQKPAILVTGDIVGIQTASDGSQDARGTMSFTRVKGDGTASLGVSADYMINAQIGNINLMRSWIGVNEKGNKHINVLSNSVSILPRSLSNTLLFVRVNSLNKFTALYGGAGTYGKLFGEEFISTLAIAGFMYKGQLFKNVDATIIAAGVWAPYTKYYTESFLESQPIIIPFLNLNYKLTKTFGIGLTGGGTYISGQDVVNYQLLCGAKLIL